MTKKERVTVDLDAECYYLDGEFWTSWDHYGEQMADEINKLLNEQEETIQSLNEELKHYKVNCLWCSHCTMSSASIHCLKREDIPYGMLDGKTEEYAGTCEFYDGDVE